MSRLKGKIALVTGGNSGIGLATAEAFVNEGAYAFITGRREAELAVAVKEIAINVMPEQQTKQSAFSSDLSYLSRISTSAHKFGWLQGTRNLLGQNSFWLRRPDTYRIHNSLAFHFAVSSSMELYKP